MTMIEHAEAEYVIILGMSSGNMYDRKPYETAMQKAFGRYFISLRSYLSKYGLMDAGLNPTEDDYVYMKTGQVPPSLLVDKVHYNERCKEIIGRMVYKQCVELNIFN